MFLVFSPYLFMLQSLDRSQWELLCMIVLLEDLDLPALLFGGSIVCLCIIMQVQYCICFHQNHNHFSLLRLT